MSTDTSNPGLVAQFGIWLKDQRTGVGLSLREAAWRSGMSPQRLTSIETGTLQVGMNTIETSVLCRTYKITSDEFLQRVSGQLA
jgi:hypothetical protein